VDLLDDIRQKGRKREKIMSKERFQRLKEGIRQALLLDRLYSPHGQANKPFGARNSQ
jgi:hypothetical protein